MASASEGGAEASSWSPEDADSPDGVSTPGSPQDGGQEPQDVGQEASANEDGSGSDSGAIDASTAPTDADTGSTDAANAVDAEGGSGVHTSTDGGACSVYQPASACGDLTCCTGAICYYGQGQYYCSETVTSPTTASTSSSPLAPGNAPLRHHGPDGGIVGRVVGSRSDYCPLGFNCSASPFYRTCLEVAGSGLPGGACSAPCKTDADCEPSAPGVPQGACIAFGSAGYCLIKCVTSSTCPAASTCESMETLSGGTANACTIW